MLALGWTLFFAVYFISFLYVMVRDITSYRRALYPWRWRWRLLLPHLLMLSDMWDCRQAAYDSLRRK